MNADIVVDMRSMDSICARVGGGIISGQFMEVLEAQQLFTPIGQNKSVGFVFWATGGGYGFYVGIMDSAWTRP